MTGLYIISFVPFEQNLLNFLVSGVLMFISAVLYREELTSTLKRWTDPRLGEISGKVTRTNEMFHSTVKTITFFYNSNKKEKVKLSTFFSEGTDQVEEGDIDMRVVPTYLGRRTSSLVVLEAKEDSLLNSHSHNRNVSYFVVKGSVKIETEDGQSAQLSSSDSYDVESRLKRKISFEKDSTVILVYSPALKNN